MSAFAKLLLPLALALLSSSALADGTRLTVVVAGIQVNKGQVFCELFASPKGFPGDVKRAFRQVWTEISQKQATCVFENLPPGGYAMVGYQDLNGDRNLNQNFIGIPTEPYMISNDAKGVLGPPSFEKARFWIGGKEFSITAHLNH